MTTCAVSSWSVSSLTYKRASILLKYEQKTHSSPGNKQKLKEANKAVDVAQAAYDTAVNAAEGFFQTASKDHPDMEFATWATHNYPSLEVKHSELVGAVSNYDQIALIVYGTGYKPLQEQKEMLHNALNPGQKTE
jgi:hypothetical protein